MLSEEYRERKADVPSAGDCDFHSLPYLTNQDCTAVLKDRHRRKRPNHGTAAICLPSLCCEISEA
jgi:hypothetical protein